MDSKSLNKDIPVEETESIASPRKPTEGLDEHCAAAGNADTNFCRVVVRSNGEEDGSLQGDEGVSDAMEIQKLLSEQSPATAKRLIISATKTTTTTRTVTKTIDEDKEEAKKNQWLSAASDMLHMSWKATKDALLASNPTPTPDEVQQVFQKQQQKEGEVARFVPSVDVVDLPLELVYTVPEVKTRMVRYTFECPKRGCMRLVPRAFPVDTPFIVPEFEDVRVPVVMSQTFVPELQETSQIVQVPVARYVPKLVPVDVYVPRPVAIPVKAHDVQQITKSATVSEELMKQLSVEVNGHIQAIENFNAQQSHVFNTLVNKSNQMAATVDCEPPAPERIDVNASTLGMTGPVDEQGTKNFQVELGGKDPQVLEVVFNRLHEEANSGKKGEENMKVTEDLVLSVYRDTNGGRLERFPSGNTSIPMIFRAEEKQSLQGQGMHGQIASGLPEPAALHSLTNFSSMLSQHEQADSATTTGESSFPVGVEASTPVPIAA